MDFLQWNHLEYYKIAKFLLILLFSATSQALYEGDDCVVPNTDGQNGKCVSILNCGYIKLLLDKGQRPEHCGFNIHFPLVCCPVSKIPPPLGQRSIDKCNKYHDINRQIFGASGGTQAVPKEFGHMAAVGYGEDKRNVLWLCGGSLISHEYVLTAAHCTFSQEFGFVKWVRLGDLDLKNTTENADPRDIAVIQIHNHPDYKAPSHYNDIALLKLEDIVFFTPFIKPACLHTTNQLPSRKLQATGWGKTSFLGDASSHLIKVDLDVIEFETCRKAFSNVSPRRLANGILNQRQICAGDVLGTGRDTCPGDSGGPLHFLKLPEGNLVKHFILIGVTSFGKACGIGETVGIYTRVSAYIEWIEDIVWPVNDIPEDVPPPPSSIV